MEELAGVMSHGRRISRWYEDGPPSLEYINYVIADPMNLSQIPMSEW